MSKGNYNHFIFVCFLFMICSGACENAMNLDFADRDHLNDFESTSILEVAAEPFFIDLDAGTTIPSLSASSLILSDFRLIPLETRKDVLIGHLDKVVLYEDKIFVLDKSIAKQVFCFDAEGRFLYKFGARGRGPGEYDEPRDFDVANGKVFIIDRQCRVFIYDLSADLQQVINLPFLSVHLTVFNDSSMFLYTHDKDDSYQSFLRQINLDYDLISSDFTIASDLVSMYDIQRPFVKNKEEVLFSKFLSDTVFHLTPGKVFAKYIFKRNSAVSPLDWDEKHSLDAHNSLNNGFLHDGYGETSDVFIFMIKQGNSFEMCFFNKKKETLWKYDGFMEDMFMMGMINYVPIGFFGDEVLFQIDVDRIAQNLKMVDMRNKNDPMVIREIRQEYNQVLKYLPDLNPNANPAILISRINPNVYGGSDEME